MKPWPDEPFWAHMDAKTSAERLFDWNEKAARIEFDDGLSRGFAEVSAYCSMTVGDPSVWPLLGVDELERLRMVSGIVDLHYARVGGASSDELKATRNHWRSRLTPQTASS